MNPEWILTQRETEVLQLLATTARGSVKRVALILGISHRTVEIHVHNARNKMRAETKTEAVLMFDRQTRKAA